MRSLFTDEMLEKLRNTGVIAVLVIDREEDAVPLARALIAGGIDIMELTLRTPAALGALSRIKREVPEMTCGIGTILTTEQIDQVADAGAAFGVAPGLNPRIIARAKEKGLPFAPGVATPSDIEAALEFGCRLLKFFPAETSGGIPHLKSMSGPYKHLGLQFIPLGGVNLNNLKTYLEFPDVIAVGGSWLAKREVINAHQWDAIESNARDAKTIVENID